MTLITATISTMLGKEVALILEVQQRPVVMVARGDRMLPPRPPSPPSGPPLGWYFTAQVHEALATPTRAALYLYVVYEIDSAIYSINIY